MPPSEDLDMKDVGQFQIYCRRIEVEDTLALRHSVLWPTKDIAHIKLPEDEAGVHLGAFLENDDRKEPVAVISLFTEDIPQLFGLSPPIHTTRTIRFRKFACDVAHQSKGIGSQLLEYTVSVARSDMNGSLLWCDARTTALSWYQQRGLEQFGDTFYKGVVEYVRMKREL
ncbi:hypothetical protein P691DRAFT_729043 [Macrolepiota fuliginosa MF-IS2]|uniref:N-acetyltransferase domain-containing protein n=1 Tax=Macrolepiota fuliginosa MF-IS2 TaxID=1400762 RepID=A0A9P5XD25_9AGAR|nr:hypothetical protein P691DRAFT_729043 [Macrolepiota fuliginosa MF-IS2]